MLEHVIGIHCAGGSGKNFDGVARHLDKLGVSYIFPDFALTYEEIISTTYEQYARKLDKYIDERKKTTLVTHSWGASIAFHYILEKPGTVNKLVCMAPVISQLRIKGFSRLPYFMRDGTSRFFNRLNQAASGSERRKSLLGMKDVGIPTVFSYMAHMFNIYSINSIPTDVEMHFPQKDSMIRCDKAYFQKLFHNLRINNVEFSTYDGQNHNSWFNDFEKIFPNGF